MMEVCTIVDLGLELSGSEAPLFIAAINAYLSEFAKPVPTLNPGSSGWLFGKHACLNCGKTLDGACGSFRWGIMSGEGTCSNCRWPARAQHWPLYEGKQIFGQALEVILQYHPDYVITCKTVETTEGTEAAAP